MQWVKMASKCSTIEATCRTVIHEGISEQLRCMIHRDLLLYFSVTILVSIAAFSVIFNMSKGLTSFAPKENFSVCHLGPKLVIPHTLKG